MMAPSRTRAVRNAVHYGLPFVALAFAALFHTAAFSMNGPLWDVAIPAFAIALMIPTALVSLAHAESVGERLGEPYGTLLLTIAVTAIEVSLITFVMLHGENIPTLARESVFSVVMIVMTGGIGLCLMLGAFRFGEQEHRLQGTSAYLAVLIALCVLLLILPNFTITTEPGTYSRGQLEFVSLLSLLLYACFLYIQTVRHRSYFLDPVPEEGGATNLIDKQHDHAPLYVGVSCLIAGLLAVVLFGERVAAGVEDGLAVLGVRRPDAIIGALIAILILFPELLAAVRASRANQLQRSVNILLGSALATIGLTIPTVVVVSIATDHELILGLPARDEILLALSCLLCVVSFGTGRTNVLTGFVHVVVFFTYVMLLAIP